MERMPRDAQDRKAAILEAVERLSQELGRFPTPQEVAADTAISLSSVRRLSIQLEADNELRRLYNGHALERIPASPCDSSTQHITGQGGGGRPE